MNKPELGGSRGRGITIRPINVNGLRSRTCGTIPSPRHGPSPEAETKEQAEERRQQYEEQQKAHQQEEERRAEEQRQQQEP